MTDRELVLQTTKCNPAQYPLMLDEKFPHILSKILSLWDSPDAEAYFNDLLQPDGRGGGRWDRDGFPDRAWQEILHLKLLHDKSHPKE